MGTITRMKIDDVIVDKDIQPRSTLDKQLVAQYARDLQCQAAFPPIIVFHDEDDHYLADGFHRLSAMKELGWEVVKVEVHEGTSARLFFRHGFKPQHGKRRTNPDKRRSVETLLNDQEWRSWSNSAIAEKCRVAESYVRKVRKRCGGPLRTMRRRFTHRERWAYHQYREHR